MARGRNVMIGLGMGFGLFASVFLVLRRPDIPASVALINLGFNITLYGLAGLLVWLCWQSARRILRMLHRSRIAKRILMLLGGISSAVGSLILLFLWLDAMRLWYGASGIIFGLIFLPGEMLLPFIWWMKSGYIPAVAFWPWIATVIGGIFFAIGRRDSQEPNEPALNISGKNAPASDPTRLSRPTEPGYEINFLVPAQTRRTEARYKEWPRKGVVLAGIFVALSLLALGIAYALRPNTPSAPLPTAIPVSSPTPTSVSPTLTPSASIYAWSYEENIHFGTIIRRYLPEKSDYTDTELLAATERAAKEFSDDWTVFYILCDMLQRAKRYGDSLDPCRSTVALRPDDIRSFYALGTAYNLLTRATWTTQEVEQFWNWLDQNPEQAALLDFTDPAEEVRLAKEALKQRRLTAQDAANAAIVMFDRALSLNPDKESRTTIEEDLSTLRERLKRLDAGRSVTSVPSPAPVGQTIIGEGTKTRSTPQATAMPKVEQITSVPIENGFRVGSLEWKVEGYTLVRDATTMEVQMLFYSAGTQTSISLDFRLIADGQQYPAGGLVRIADLQPQTLTAVSDRTAQQVEPIYPNQYMRVTVMFHTPASCLSAGNEIDACMRSKQTKIRWLQHNLELPISMR